MAASAINAGIESPERQFTDSERQKLREQIRDFYNGFIEKVAAARKLPVAKHAPIHGPRQTHAEVLKTLKETPKAPVGGWPAE